VTPAPAPDARCEIRDSDVTIDGSATLSVEGKTFAQQAGPFARFDVMIRGAIARVKLEDDVFALEGELALAELAARPREIELRDRWVEIRHAIAREAAGDSVQLEVELPRGLEPAEVVFAVPCRGATLAQAPEPPEGETTDLVEVPIGTQLRATIDGPAIARITGAPDPDDPSHALQSLDATVLERRGSMTRLKFDGTNPVVAWASSLALRAPVGRGLGGFGFGRTGRSKPSSSCRRDVPIYVRIEERLIRVGRVKKEQAFYFEDDVGATPEMWIELGLAKPEVRPFIKRGDYKDACE
jgi:hypothetical protein